MAIIRCFEEWRAELQSSVNPIKVLSDHKNLEYFMTNKLLSRRRARWAQFLSQFDFKIVYRPGKLGGIPDALTRRSGDLPKPGDERENFNFSTLLKPDRIVAAPIALAPEPAEPAAEPEPAEPAEEPAAAPPPDPDDVRPLAPLFAAAYAADPFPAEVLRMLDGGVRHDRRISLGECTRDGLHLRFRERLCVPDYDPLRLRLLKTHHEAAAADHPGRSKTLKLLKRTYFWPKMQRDVDRFVRDCHVCQRSRTACHAPSASYGRSRSRTSRGRILPWILWSASRGGKGRTPSGSSSTASPRPAISFLAARASTLPAGPISSSSMCSGSTAYRLGPGIPDRSGLLAAVLWPTGDRQPAEHRLPPRDRRADRARERGDGAVPPGPRVVSPRRLGHLAAARRVRGEQPSIRIHRCFPLLWLVRPGPPVAV